MIIEGAWRGVAVVYANPMGLSTAERIENELRSKEVPTILLQYADTDSRGSGSVWTVSFS